MDNKTYWGYHLILDCAGCNFEKITDPDNIKDFLSTLIPAIDMVAHGEPIVEFLLSGEDNQGYSVLQMITTSNITAHFVNRDCSGYIDIFSCKEFDINIANRIVGEFFEPINIKHQLILRQADIAGDIDGNLD
jgi:S-adenosylmethionine/arginine decarboxylase-like enzyme